jgi:hypothetical protein
MRNFWRRVQPIGAVRDKQCEWSKHEGKAEIMFYGMIKFSSSKFPPSTL